MSKYIKRILSLLLAAVLVFTVCPWSFASDIGSADVKVFTEEDDKLLEDDVFADIDTILTNAEGKKRATEALTEDYYISLIPQVRKAVEESSTYVEGTLTDNGNVLIWETTVGIPCTYNPHMMVQLNDKEEPTADQIAAIDRAMKSLKERSAAHRGGSPSNLKIGLIQPFWDSNDHYQDEHFCSTSTYYYDTWDYLSDEFSTSGMRYTMENATIDNVAKTIQECGVVLIDSHGAIDTEYSEDAVTSYLVLLTSSGMTSEDGARRTDENGNTYYGFLKDSEHTFVNGEVIARHMTKNAPHSLVYFATCNSMTTKYMYEPLRQKGVEVCWGYSQSVSFHGDLIYMLSIMDYLDEGKTFGVAAEKTKEEYGYWDPYYYEEGNTVEFARENELAFPICVSSEDAYPGRRNVDAIQYVRSTWTFRTTTSNYSLSYNANGGSGAPSSQTGSSTYTISDTVPTRFGYTFLGWSANSNATFEAYKPGNSIFISSNTTLYAVWEAAASVSTGSSTSVTVSFGYQAWYYKFTPSSSGTYTFETTGSLDTRGYLYNSSGSQLAENDDIDGTNNRNFRIQYSLTGGSTYYLKVGAYSNKTGSTTLKISGEAATYTVTYNANGGSVSPTSVNVSSGSSTTLPTPTKSYKITYNANGGSSAPSAQTFAFTCSGWATSSSATTASYSCGSTYKPTANVTFYAVWPEYSEDNLSTVIPTRSGYSFLGWAQTSDATEAEFEAGELVRVSGNATLYAVWGIKNYTLTYNANGGSGAPSSQTGATGYTISGTRPTRFGYNFLGWSKTSSATSATYVAGDSITLTANVTLYAVWKQVTLSSASSVTAPITYDGQMYYYKFTPSSTGKYVIYSTGSDDTKVYLYNSSGTELANNDDGGSSNNFRLAQDLTSGTTYYYGVRYYSSSKTGNISVSFGPVYMISYNANGGSGAPSSQSKDYGASLTLSSDAPTKTYTITYNANASDATVSSSSKSLACTFNKWNTAAAGTGTSYAKGASYTTNSNATLYAQWNNPTAGTLATASRSGYTFDGWYTAASGGTKVTSSSTITGNTTLYAHWTKNTYTLSYNANGGSSAPESQTGDVSYTVSTALPSRVGYTFLGWSKSSSATSASYLPGSSITISENTTLYAVWKQQTITSGSIISVPITYGKQMYFYKFVPTVSKTYVIYSTGSADTKVFLCDSSGSQLATNDDGGSGNNFRLSYAMTEGNTYYFGICYYSSSATGTITVKFGSVYTISFNANGGSGAPAAQGKDYAAPLTLTSDTPSGVKTYTITYNTNASGVTVDPSSKTVSCTFNGWNTKKAGTGTSYDPGAEFNGNGDTTLYAQWSDPTAGTLPAPTRSGYIFDGWYTASDSGTKVTSSTPITANTTLYAHWIRNTFTLIFNLNGGSGSFSALTGASSYSIPTAAPTRFAYNFLGWSTNATAEKASYKPGVSISLTDDTTLYAVWQQKAISSGSALSVPIARGGQIYYYKFTPTVSKTYVIYSTGSADTKVWLYNASGTQIASNDDGGSGKNFRLSYAMEAGSTYYFGIAYYNSGMTGTIPVRFGTVCTVTYNANGGSGAPAAQLKYYAEALTLSSSAPSTAKSFKVTYNANGGTTPTASATLYCTFAGWNTKAAGSGTSYAAGAEYSAHRDATLYAQWTNPSAGTLPTPERVGYAFDGWYTAANGGTKVSSATKITANTALYAHWKANKYSVSFDGNGANDGSMSDQVFTYGISNALDPCAYLYYYDVRYNYNGATRGNKTANEYVTASFNGWAISAGGSKVYNNMQSVLNLAVEGTVTLYAKWTPGTTTLPTPVRTGYTFDGWYKDASFTQFAGAGGASFKPTADTELYAKWTACDASVTAAKALSTDPYYAKAVRDYQLTVRNNPDKIQFISSTGSTVTTSRAQSTVTKGKNGTEKWIVSVALKADIYEIKAKIGADWETNSFIFTVDYDEKVLEPEGAIASVKPLSQDPYYARSARLYSVTVKGKADKIQFITSTGSSTTYSKTSAAVTGNGNGTETWIISAALKADTYTVRTKKGTTWNENEYRYKVSYAQRPLTVEDIVFTVNVNGTTAEFNAVTMSGVSKIQLVNDAGSAVTFSADAYSTVEEDGLRHWSVTRTVKASGTGYYALRVKTNEWSETGKKVFVN